MVGIVLLLVSEWRQLWQEATGPRKGTRLRLSEMSQNDTKCVTHGVLFFVHETIYNHTPVHL